MQRRLHSLLARPPRCYGFADLPTPVERAPWLDAGGSRVWVKRDDASSALYGGGKVRKLEWLLANPPYDGDEPIMTIGGHGSHHLVATGLFARQLGRKLHALIFEQEATEHAYRNLGVLASIGAEFWAARRRIGLPWAYASYYTWRRPERIGKYLTPGGSTALGSFGCVEAGLELAAQIEAGELERPDRLYITAGTAGTSAGIAIGLGLRKVSTHLRLISAAEPIGFNRFMYGLKLRAIYSELRRCGLEGPSSVSDLLRDARISWSVSHEQLGGGYGVPTEAGRAAVDRAADHGLELETTYTGKCLAALLADQLPDGTNALFWNTHGANDLRSLLTPDWEARLPTWLARNLTRARPRALAQP